MFATIQTSKITRCTCIMYGGFHLVIPFQRITLFSDIPKGQGDLILSVLIYSRSQRPTNQGMVSSPSSSSINSNATVSSNVLGISFFNSALKRNGTLGTTNPLNSTRDRHVADTGDIGSFLGDLTIVIPSGHSFGKIHQWHSINSSKKSIGRLQVQLAIQTDLDFVPIPVHINF